MKLKSLLKDVKVKETHNFKNVNVTNLSIRADELTKNGLYFAIKGNNFDGKTFIPEAINCGAKVIVTDVFVEGVTAVQIVVEDIRIALSIISRTFFNKTDEKLRIIGFVGTNGKTTSSTILYNILKDNGESVGLIGTNGVFINDLSLPNNFTTPDPIELFYTLEQMYLFGVKYVIMEISAQAIYYNKVYGICPDILVYTNISNEHLDFFKTMENYSKTKLNYIENCGNSIKVINVDDKYGCNLVNKLSKNGNNCQKVYTYGLENPADIFAVDIKQDFTSSDFMCNCLDEIMEIESNLTGDYNIYNLLSVVISAKILGVNSEVIRKSIKELQKVDGRWEVFDFPNNNKVIVDYAHTPDGFEKVFKSVKRFRKGRIITLFGCVGYSDKKKRKLMGDLASKYSDFVVITSDNFSDSKFDEIVDDIGITKYYAKIQNRAEAVDFSLGLLKGNDTLLLLGKGAETYQKTSNGNELYNEVEYVKNYLEKMGKK